MSQPLYNHLPQTLKNHYIIQRHGYSLANDEKLICSNPAIAIPPLGGPLNTGYGLHEKGKIQVKEVSLHTCSLRITFILTYTYSLPLNFPNIFSLQKNHPRR